MLAKLDEINNTTGIEIEKIKNYDFVMSNRQFNRYKKFAENLPMRSQEAWEQCIARNNELYTDYSNKLETLCSEKTEKINISIDKISAAIKEANKKAYIDFVQKNIIGYWISDNCDLIFKDAGQFEYSYYKKSITLITSEPERVYAGSDGVVRATGRIKTPEQVRKFSGKYSFQDDVLILDVKSAKYKNMPKINSGDTLKVKISFANNGNKLKFGGQTFKRDD